MSFTDNLKIESKKNGTPLTYHKDVVDDIVKYFSSEDVKKIVDIDPLMISVAHLDYFHDNYGANPFEFISKNQGKLMDQYYPGMAVSLHKFANKFIEQNIGQGELSDLLPIDVKLIDVPLKDNYSNYFSKIGYKPLESISSSTKKYQRA